MKRSEKYQDTQSFHFYNANPKNRITTDCVIRALSTALEIPYNQVVMEMAELQCKTGFDPSETKTIDKYLQQHGWVKQGQPRKWDKTKYTGKEFCEEALTSKYGLYPYKDQRIVANMGSHHIVAIVNGQVWDTWNSTGGKVGIIWTKK